MVDPASSDDPERRSLLVIAAVAALAVAAIALIAWIALRDESPADPPRQTTTTTPDDPDAAAGDDAEADPPVELSPVQGQGEAELCSGIVARLEEYRAVAADGRVDQALLEALTEFQAQVDTQSDDQDWGDRIIEALTNTRREWATALAAEAQGDDASAQERYTAAIGHLDTAIEDAACPEG